MKEEKNIDRGIREKLEDFQVSPPPHIWNNVQDNLLAAKRRRRMAYAGWISAAAVVVLAFIAGWFFNENSQIGNDTELSELAIEAESNNQTEKEKAKDVFLAETEKEDELESETTDQPDNVMVASAVTTGHIEEAEESGIQALESRKFVLFAKLESEEERLVSKEKPNANLAKRDEFEAVPMLSAEDEMLIAENIKNIQSSSEKEGGWKMGMFVAPGYSSFNANHSDSYAQEMTYSGNTGTSNIGGGVSVQYKTQKRWIFESGLYYNQTGQESNNPMNILAQKTDEDLMFEAPENVPERIPTLSSNVRVENQNLVMNSTAGIIEFKSTPKGTTMNKEFDKYSAIQADVFIPEGEFSQVFDFMEIPLFVRYRVVDSKFGLELITGFNAGIVVGNNSYLNNQYGLQNVGETKDISTVNVSGTLGLGLNYALGKHFSVALEPRYNHYLNSINTNSSIDFRPYRFGLYSGLTYEF